MLKGAKKSQELFCFFLNTFSLKVKVIYNAVIQTQRRVGNYESKIGKSFRWHDLLKYMTHYELRINIYFIKNISRSIFLEPIPLAIVTKIEIQQLIRGTEGKAQKTF